MADPAVIHNQTVTLAEICEAISNRELPCEQKGPWYVIQRNDIKALAARLPSRKALSVPLAPAS